MVVIILVLLLLLLLFGGLAIAVSKLFLILLLVVVIVALAGGFSRRGRFADWFNNRRWSIRYLFYAEWVILVTFVALVTALSV